jgi:WD40 repeat protein
MNLENLSFRRILILVSFALLICWSIQAEGFAPPILHLAWNVDGSLITTIHDYFNGSIKVFDPVLNLTILDVPYSGRAAISWHPTDPNLLAITSSQQNAQIINVRTGSIVTEFDEASVGNAIAYSRPDGTKLAIGEGDPDSSILGLGEVRIIDVSTGSPLALIQRIRGGVTKVEWHSDGDRIAALGGGEVIIWNIETQTQIGVISELEEVNDETGNYFIGQYETFDWHPQSELLAVANPANIILWSTDSYTQIWRDIIPIESLDWSPNGLLLSQCEGDG